MLAACGKRETPVEAGVRTKTLLLGNQNEPASLDPHVADSYTDQIIITALFEGLTVTDEKSTEARPGIAERWETSADGKEWTFHLRPALWSNGDPVTAQDFAWSFQRILSPQMGMATSYMLWVIKNAERYNKGDIKDFSQVGVRVADDRTLVVTLERPTPYLPILAAHTTWLPLHRASLEKTGRPLDRASPWVKAGEMVGNGPYVLTEWRANARLVVTRNPRYWDNAHTHLERVEFFPIENSDTEERNFRAGQMHVTFDLPKSKLAAYRAQSPALLRTDPLLGVLFLNFNINKKPFDDLRVRRALGLAIDRDVLARQVMNGSYLPGPSVVPDFGGYHSQHTVALNLAEARRLLAEAGYPGGKGFPGVPVMVRNDQDQPRLMEAIQGMWLRDLGVHVTIEPSEQKTWLQNQQTMSHQLAFNGWVADFADPVDFLDIFRTGNGQNWSGWGSKIYDGLLDEAAGTADEAKRLALFQQAEGVLLDEMPVIPVVFRTRSYLIQPTVKNWEPAPIGLHRFQLIDLEK